MHAAPRVRPLLLVAVALCVAAAAAAGKASAAPADPRVRAARAHFENGVAHYNLDEFAPALTEFTEAYRLKPDPSFLFNIAQCHRRLGATDAAIDYYRKYLRNMPDAPNRAEVERMMAELRARSPERPAPSPSAETAREPAPTSAPAPAPAAPAPAPAPPAPAAAPSLVATSAAPAPTSAAPSPFYRRWWFWTALGAVAAGAAVAIAVSTSGSEDPYVGSLGITRVP